MTIGRRLGRSLALGLFSLLALVSAPALAGQAGLQPLEIITASGAHKFEVEVADTQKEREKGLMLRRSMPRSQGMLFDFHKEDMVLMWMKDTYIPLDMVFVSRGGRVISVTHDAAPMSEGIISSGQPAYGVIELNAGVAREIGVAIGDKVRHPVFRP